MNIGIVGTGGVGRALGILWSRQGHEVCFGARDLDASREAAARSGGRYGDFEAAARFGEALLYTLRSGPEPAAPASTSGGGGPLVIDCREASPAGERPPPAGVRLVRAFFKVPQEALDFAEAVPLCEYGVPILLCGDDEGAKATAALLAEQLGFLPVDCGPLHNARVVSALGNAIYALAGRWPLGASAGRPAPGWLAAA